MKTRPLGQSGIEASVIGFGAWATGGWMWGGTDEADSIAAVHASLDAGVNLIDTAAIYGFGMSESIIGRAIRDRRDRVVLATKCSMICNPTRGVFKFRSTAAGPDAHGHIVIHICGAPDSIRREVEDSLRRLGTDYIDLYQTHWQDTTTPIADTMGALMELKQAGKIRAIGVCNASSAQMEEYARAGSLDTDQEHYSMLQRDIEQDQLPYCREQGLAVLAYSPLARGLLTGAVGPDRQFEPGDHRAGLEMFSVDNRRRVARMLDQFRPIAERHGITLAQLAIAWTVAQPGLTHALCGARNARQAEENAAAGDIELSESELKTMNEIIAAHGR
jgi:aryl-alcohol dehydrogenase-like predicted oxidoreductase